MFFVVEQVTFALVLFLQLQQVVFVVHIQRPCNDQKQGCVVDRFHRSSEYAIYHSALLVLRFFPLDGGRRGVMNWRKKKA